MFSMLLEQHINVKYSIKLHMLEKKKDSKINDLSFHLKKL